MTDPGDSNWTFVLGFLLIFKAVDCNLHDGSGTMIGRNRGHPELVHDRLALVEDVDGVRLVGRQLADESLPLSN